MRIYIMKTYTINGHAFLWRKYLHIVNGEDDEGMLDTQVTKHHKIKVYLDPGCCLDEDKTYYQSFKSSRGFVVGDILDAIIKTYWSFTEEYLEGDPSQLQLSVSRFKYDKTTRSVYPNLDS